MTRSALQFGAINVGVITSAKLVPTREPRFDGRFITRYEMAQHLWKMPRIIRMRKALRCDVEVTIK